MSMSFPRMMMVVVMTVVVVIEIEQLGAFGNVGWRETGNAEDVRQVHLAVARAYDFGRLVELAHGKQ